MMILCSNKSATCKWLYVHLQKQGIKCTVVTGKIPLGERKGLIDAYLEGEVNVLICTDLASRGINTVRVRILFFVPSEKLNTWFNLSVNNFNIASIKICCLLIPDKTCNKL